jgi:hypothetical protein
MDTRWLSAAFPDSIMERDVGRRCSSWSLLATLLQGLRLPNNNLHTCEVLGLDYAGPSNGDSDEQRPHELDTPGPGQISPGRRIVGDLLGLSCRSHRVGHTADEVRCRAIL